MREDIVDPRESSGATLKIDEFWEMKHSTRNFFQGNIVFTEKQRSNMLRHML